MITPSASIHSRTPSASAPAPPAAAATADLKEAAQKFEAIFIRQMLSAARAANFGGSDIFSGPGLEQFNAMQDENMARIASETGAFGFAKVIEAQLAAQTATAPTALAAPTTVGTVAKRTGGEG